MIVRVLLALAMLAVGFGAQVTASAQDATPAAPSGDPIVLGAAIHQSGWMAAYDLPSLASAELAVEQINAAGGVLGRPLELVVGDGQTDPATVGNVAIELIDGGVFEMNHRSASSGTALTCPAWCATAAMARSRLVGE